MSIKDKAVIKGGSVYIKELDETYSKNEISNMTSDQQKMLLGFMDKKELEKIMNWSDRINMIVTRVFSNIK